MLVYAYLWLYIYIYIYRCIHMYRTSMILYHGKPAIFCKHSWMVNADNSQWYQKTKDEFLPIQDSKIELDVQSIPFMTFIILHHPSSFFNLFYPSSASSFPVGEFAGCWQRSTNSRAATSRVRVPRRAGKDHGGQRSASSGNRQDVAGRPKVRSLQGEFEAFACFYMFLFLSISTFVWADFSMFQQP